MMPYALIPHREVGYMTDVNAKYGVNGEQSGSKTDAQAHTPYSSKSKLDRAARQAPREQTNGSTISAAPRQYANSSSIKADSARKRRYRMRDGLRNITNNPRVRGCGRTRISDVVTLRTDAAHTRVGYGGLSTCGSVWCCPVCAAKIAAKRKTEVMQVCEYALDQGCEVSLLTLTMRHHRGQSLRELWDALAYAWAAVTSGRPWLRFCEKSGLVGYIKATEVTYGEQYGWHVHLHVLVITRQSVYIPIPTRHSKTRGDYDYRCPDDIIAERWARSLARKGIESVADQGGLDWDVARDAEAAAAYVAKFGQKARPADRISSELTLGTYKQARRGNRTPWQVLDDLICYGLADDYDIWREYEQVSAGRRALTWSHGLRQWANIGKEQTDEEIAAQGAGDTAIAAFPPAAWIMLQPHAAELLDLLQKEGKEEAVRWLTRSKIPFVLLL